MTVREFAMVACKILGLYFMLIGLAGLSKSTLTLIASFSSLVQAQVEYSMLGPIFSTLLSPIVEIGIGFYVWSVADAIAARITRDDS